MDIIGLRAQFKEDSGFLHWTDFEIDKVINQGLLFLDQKCFSSRKNSRIWRTLAAGSNRVVFGQRLHIVKDVWLIDNVKRERLEKIDLEEIRSQDFTSGRPLHYLPIEVMAYSRTMDYFTVPGKFADVNATDEYAGLAFDRVADQEYYVEIYGKFYTVPFSDTYTQNWWSIFYPELIIQAALYTVDMKYRNSSGGKELYDVIMDTIREINNDDIEEEMEGVSMAMEG